MVGIIGIMSFLVHIALISLVYIVFWRAMKAHESIANSIKIISEKLDLRE